MYRIAIVEDDPIMQEVMRDTLRPEGYELVVFPDGESALKSIPGEKPDLIILDVNLPGMNGFEVCRGLKSDPKVKHVPVLMLTGEAREVEQRVEGLDLGAEDYMFKPVSPRVLVSRVRGILKLATKPFKK